jgi:type I restriction-modification system DNA methylase subunit
MPANHTDLEKQLWGAADELRANSKLKSSEYSVPVLGLIFLRYADHQVHQSQGEAHLLGQRIGSLLFRIRAQKAAAAKKVGKPRAKKTASATAAE